MMRIVKELKPLRWLIIISLVLTAAGFILDWKGFLVNTFSGLLGAVIGIWVSIEVIQVALDNRQKEEWQIVRDLVLDTIETQLTKSCLEFVNLRPSLGPYVGLLDDVGKATEHKLNTISTLYDELSKLEIGAVRKEQYIELRSRVRPHLDRIFNFQLVNVSMPGQATELAEQLIRLERADRNWDNAVYRDSKWGVSKEALAKEAISTLEMLAETYRQLISINS